MVSVTTTNKLIISVRKPTDFVLHAVVANTATVNVSATDLAVLTDYEELLAGQDLSFEGFVGDVWAVAASGTQTLTIPFRSDGKVTKAL